MSRSSATISPCTCTRAARSSPFCDPDCASITDLHNLMFSLPPAQAIKAAEKYHPSSPVINAMTTKGGNALYRRAGLPGLFLRQILNGDATGANVANPYWRNPVLGLSNTIAGILRENSEVADAGVLQELQAAYPRIIDVLWRDIECLKIPGDLGDANRTFVANLIRTFVKDVNFRRIAVEERTIFIVVHCWLETGPDSRLSRTPVIDAMAALFSSLSAPAPARYLEIAQKSFDMPYFMARANAHFRAKNLSGPDLAQELNVRCHLINTKEPFARHFVKARAHRHVMAAVLRALKNEEAAPDFVEEILETTAIFTTRLLQHAADPVDMLTDLFAQSALAEVGVAGLKVTSKAPAKGARGEPIEPWYSLFENVWHCITCETPHGRCTLQGMRSPAFMDAARAAFEPLAIPMLRYLRTGAGHQPKYLALWSQIVTKLGMTGASIRERHRIERKCCNIICPARIAGKPTGKKMTCSTCQYVYYCDRVCQKEDWKNHKEECIIVSSRC